MPRVEEIGEEGVSVMMRRAGKLCCDRKMRRGSRWSRKHYR